MDASFSRLRGRGAFIVSSSFDKATKSVGVTTIESGRGEDCVLRRPQSWSRAALKVTASGGGGAVALQWFGDGDAFFSFPTATGATYTLEETSS